MSYQHQTLAAGRWRMLSFSEQLAHIGSEVERAISWRKKENTDYSRRAFERALELCDLTLRQPLPEPRLKEVARVRAALVDDFDGTNSFHSTDSAWQRYFAAFTYAAAIKPKFKAKL